MIRSAAPLPSGSSAGNEHIFSIGTSTAAMTGPVATSLSTASAQAGQQVTINGSGFGSSQGPVDIFASSAHAQVNQEVRKVAQPTGFADIVERVKPSVISVKVAIGEKTAAKDDSADPQGKFFKAYSFTAKADHVYRFVLTSKEFDPYLRLEDAAGKHLANEHRILGGLSAEEQRQLAGLLRKLSLTLPPEEDGQP